MRNSDVYTGQGGYFSFLREERRPTTFLETGVVYGHGGDGVG